MINKVNPTLHDLLHFVTKICDVICHTITGKIVKNPGYSPIVDTPLSLLSPVQDEKGNLIKIYGVSSMCVRIWNILKLKLFY